MPKITTRVSLAFIVFVQIVQTTAEGTLFSGCMSTALYDLLICGALEKHLLTYLLTHQSCHSPAAHGNIYCSHTDYSVSVEYCKQRVCLSVCLAVRTSPREQSLLSTISIILQAGYAHALDRSTASKHLTSSISSSTINDILH